MATKTNILESVREEDFVEYYLFPNITATDDKEQELALNRLLNQAEKIVEKHTRDYLWHKDEFQLSVRTCMSNTLNEETKEPLPPHLYGVTHFGDNIEDEWFIVYLLRELTLKIDGLIARICDSDGEFLLIEAADYLPPWADPATCEKKVYLYQGNIHIFPPSLAVDFAQIQASCASSDVQNSFINKLQNYPEKIHKNLHHATAYLPIGVASILNHKPNLISAAVQAFCNRDPIDAKACKAMKYFPPENRINFRVKFTKCLYAMLKHQKFAPDRRTGWNLPKSDSPQFKSHDLGVKIACGFEILAAQAKPSPDLDTDKAWHNYLKQLKEKNYFRGLLENSRDYNDLLNKAKEFYINHRDSMRCTPMIGQEILTLLRTLDKVEQANEIADDDDESWLDITPEELDKMLQEKYGKNFKTVNNNSDAGLFSETLTQFLDHVSDIDGVEHPPKKVSFAQGTKSDTANRISFDPNSFSCAVQNILNFMIPEDDSWESDSDMSDYADEESVEETKRMKEYMDEMDRELAKTTIGESFEKKKNGDSFEDIENFQPVDIDVNALKNILESYKAQMGEAGPSTNMLGPMGLHLDVAKEQD